MLFHLFNRLRETVPGANVFRYVSTRVGLATLTALLITFLVAPWFIRRARERQLGEVIRDDGPASHASKKGTPTMGGALIILALVAATLLWCDLRSTLVWLTLLVTVGFGAVGFVDDYLKISRKNKKGLSGKLKLLGQFVIGGIAVVWLFTSNALPVDVRLRLAPPMLNFDKFRLALPLAVYIAFGIFVLMAESNAVNLTDGLDGLAIGPVIICAFTFMLLSYAAGQTLAGFNVAHYLGMAHVVGAGELAVFCGAIGGAGIGFLWFNTHPAQVFMGDVGALSLGGAIGMLAVLTKNEIVLLIVGGLFVVEALSVMVQVGWFKFTKKRFGTGRRILKMAPLHHHFEKSGWKETQVVVRFWIITMLLCLIGLASLKLR